ncbi:VOC family protein [Leifsonia shinshuensis]|uniref:Catechol 2,3-dioxygenase n=1 Tax=Leifsonia shinshuensis TaxID=150026 RepID=A0A853D2L3_9MICO|nr:VOC family protein [Leifsonia shinshuensis]NYJ25624.1 catechol 2,3-dioxygenase [Leifsonia shinshuensis]
MADYTAFDVAHLANVELLTPKFEESLWFFKDLLAMREVTRVGDSAYLRCWDEYQQYTIKLTASDAAGVGRTSFRAASPEALERRVAAIDGAGLGEGWVEGEVGTGRTFLFRDPDGHEMGIYYDTERYVASDEDRPALKNQASAYPGRGVNARRLDHINFLAKDVEANGEFIAAALGGRESERIKLDNGKLAAWWFHFSLKSYDVVYSDDWTKHGNRLHHIAFAPDTREDILKGADIFLENGIHIESGPHKHAINQTFFLYVWEPGGNRIEFANAGARLLLDPDQPVVEWSEEERKKGQAWGMKTIETFHTHGTPIV